MNPVFQAVFDSDVNALNNSIIQGNKINTLLDNSDISVLDFAILNLKYSMVKPICVFVNLLLPSEKSKMINNGLKTLIKAMDKYVALNSNEDLTDDLVVFNELKNTTTDLSLIVDDTHNTLYHYAIKMNCVELFDILIQGNIDTNVLNDYKQDPLLLSFIYNRTNFIQTLIPKSNNLLKLEEYSNRSLLHYGVMIQNFEIVQQLLTAAPSLIDMVDNMKKSALHYVVERLNHDVIHNYIDYFVSKSANLNLQDHFGDTVLHILIRRANNLETCSCLVKKLIDNGASMYIKNNMGIMPIELQNINKNFINDICK